MEEVGFLPRVGELDDVLSGDTISLGQRREEMAYGVTADTQEILQDLEQRGGIQPATMPQLPRHAKHKIEAQFRGS